MVSIILQTLWQLPQAIPGLLLVLFGRATHHDSDGAFFYVARPGGLLAWWLKTEDPSGTGAGSWAITCGTFILCASDAAVTNQGLRAHELNHKWWGNVLGPLFWLAYGVAMNIAWLQGKLPLRENFFERKADEAGARAEVEAGARA